MNLREGISAKGKEIHFQSFFFVEFLRPENDLEVESVQFLLEAAKLNWAPIGSMASSEIHFMSWPRQTASLS